MGHAEEIRAQDEIDRRFPLGTGHINTSPETLEQRRTREFNADVLTTALEGGIGYWSQASEIQRDADLRVLSVKLQPECDPDDFEPRTVTPADVDRGIGLILAGTVKVRGDILESVRADVRELIEGEEIPGGNIDADGADVIVQAAMFGEIVFG